MTYGDGTQNAEKTLFLRIPGESEDRVAAAAALTDQLGCQVVGLAGVMYESQAEDDSCAFQGPFIPPSGEDGYSMERPIPTATVIIGSTDPIREQITQVRISDERLAEISDGYVFPDHLGDPDNPIDATISFVVSKLASIELNESTTFAEQALESRTTEILKNSDLSFAQAEAAMHSGEVAFESGNENTLYKAEKLEALEHVLRFLLYREYTTTKKYGREFKVRMGTDYHWASGMLGEALVAVNGYNGFAEIDSKDQGLAMGSLPSKLNIVVMEDSVMISGSLPGEMKPIWPQSEVDKYEAAKAETAETARLREEERQAARRERQAAIQAAAEQRAAQVSGIKKMLEPLKEQGFVWKGVMPLSGRLATQAGLDEYIKRTYPDKEVQVVKGFAVYGGTKVTADEGSVTIFVKE